MRDRRTLRMTTVAATVGLLVLVVGSPPAVARPRTVATVTEPVATSMAALGDSITRGYNACGWFVDCTSRSWSTGSGNGVLSHFERLQAADPRTRTAHNLARAGSKMGELATQAQNAVDNGVDYVTILMGANDACTSTESAMTPVADFASQFTSAMDVLTTGLPDAKVLVASIPDIHRLWEVGKDSSSARSAWNLYGICQSMLVNPTSTNQADVDRRRRVRQRVIDYNWALADVCASHDNCRFDDHATFSYPFELGHLSNWDYFHPDLDGQNVLVEVTWNASLTWVVTDRERAPTSAATPGSSLRTVN